MESVIRFFKVPKQSFFLFGPRGTGKSYWTKENLLDALRLDLLDPETYRSFSARPERLRESIEGNPQKSRIVIDEVQKVPELLSVVHGLIEKNRKLQFILTGSSSRKLKRSGVDLMAGRALNLTLHPFMAAELGTRFSLSEGLKRGSLPLVLGAPDPDATLNGYVGLYLREEVQAEGLVRNIGNFSRFLEAISFSQGAVLNMNNVARDCEVERKTVEGFVEILEDLLLAFRVPVFTKRAKRELVSHPKFYFFDSGVFRSIRPKGPLDRPEETDGAALEGLVVQHLRAWIAYRGKDNSLFYWRTRSGAEVDSVIYGEDGLWAIEVKNNKRIRLEDLRSLKAFKEDYPASIVLLLYRGSEKLKMGDIQCIPVDEFLKQLRPDKGIH